MAPLRVIGWSTGNVGSRVVRAVADDPRFELAGAVVYSAAKAGRDVGELVGVAPLGVTATDDPDALDGVEADAVVHSPLPSLVHGDDPGRDLDVICGQLAAGRNVVTTVGYLYPVVHGPDVVGRLEEACRSGRTTFHGSGLNPGWMGDLLPLSMTALSRTVERIHVTEISDFARYPSPEIMLDMMGFGRPPDVFEREGRRRRDWLNWLFRESTHLVAAGLGVELDEVEDRLDVDVTAGDLEVAAGTLAAGTVAGQHWTWTGRRHGRDVIVHETVWRMGPDTGVGWPTGDHSIVIDGDPPLRVELGPRWLGDGLTGTAMHALNAVPAVVAAPPGIVTRLDLPPVHGRLL